MADQDEQQRLAMKDYDFRQNMQARKEQDPAALRWVELDAQASTLEEKVQRDERRLERRPNDVLAREQELNDARQDRQQWREENPRPGMFSGKQKEWDQQYQELDAQVSEARKGFTAALAKASPEELNAIKQKIEERREALVNTIAERQGVAMLPSEEAAKVQEKAQQQNSGAELVDRIADRRAEQAARNDDSQDDGTRAGRRLQPNFAAYAETTEQREASRQLEEDQNTMHLRLGRRATNEEMLAFEQEKRHKQDQESSQQGNQASSQDVAAQQPSRGGQLANRLEARREEQGSKETSTYAERMQRQEQAQQQRQVQQQTASSQAQYMHREEDGHGASM